MGMALVEVPFPQYKLPNLEYIAGAESATHIALISLINNSEAPSFYQNYRQSSECSD
jgi:hypothetical protein